MNILMLLESDFPPDIRVENEIKALSNLGHKIFLICPTKTKRSNEQVNDHLYILRSPISKFIYKSKVGQLKFPFYNNYWKKIVTKQLRKIEFEINLIHIHDLSLASVGVWLKNKINVPLLMDLHENYPYLIKDALHTQKGIGKWLSDYKSWVKFESKVVTKADYICCVVEEMKERLMQFEPNEKKYLVYQNVVDASEIEAFKPKKSTENFELIYVGGITPARGLQTVIEAIKILNQQNIFIHFSIYGDGSYREQLEKLVDLYRLNELVNFHGSISQKDVFTKIKKSNLAIIPHHRSVQNNCSSPNKLFQYLSQGTPVIVSNCDSLKRIVNKHFVGFVYTDNDPNDLASNLKKAVDQKEALVQMGINGSNIVKNLYNTEIEGEKLQTFYSKILE